jgi:acyl carrier protein
MNTEALLKRFIIDELLVGDSRIQVTNDASLLSSGVIDSLSLIRLINFIEEQFHVTIEDEEVVPENFETINALLVMINGKQN